jgi:hypothetical protein
MKPNSDTDAACIEAWVSQKGFFVSRQVMVVVVAEVVLVVNNTELHEGYVSSNPRRQGGLPQAGGHDCDAAECVGADSGSL